LFHDELIPVDSLSLIGIGIGIAIAIDCQNEKPMPIPIRNEKSYFACNGLSIIALGLQVNLQPSTYYQCMANFATIASVFPPLFFLHCTDF
jgi:hypothetical protein